ncbi:MAG TPA: cation-transporting P-type ATPase, partial [Candidatus Binatia bacterium]|nr:cation-transporting P-type ATPase [Candidatus Binatia bacterium]
MNAQDVISGGAVGPGHRARSASAAAPLFELTRLAADAACRKLDSDAAGLAIDEAKRRLATSGPNLVTRERKPSVLREIWSCARNPLNALLLALALISGFLGDARAAVV